MDYKIRKTPDVLASYGGLSSNQPLYTRRQPKLQLAKNTRDVMQIGAKRRPLGDSTLELAVTERGGLQRFRLTEVGVNGDRRRFNLRLSDLQTVIGSLHKAKSIMEAAQ